MLQRAPQPFLQVAADRDMTKTRCSDPSASGRLSRHTLEMAKVELRKCDLVSLEELDQRVSEHTGAQLKFDEHTSITSSIRTRISDLQNSYFTAISAYKRQV